MLPRSPAGYRRAAFLTAFGALVVCALAFPHHGPGGAALVVLVGPSGAGVARLGERIHFELPRWAKGPLVVSAVAAASVVLFSGTWLQGGLRAHDWAAHHANLSHLVESLRHGNGVPRWVHGVSTGDSPYELYPEVRTSQRWRECSYSAWFGAYRCPGGLLVRDGTENLISDAPPSWPFAVPAVVLSATDRGADVRIRLSPRLAGEYWAETSGASVRLTTPVAAHVLDGTRSTLSFDARDAPQALTLETSVPAGQTVRIALARRNHLDPARRYPRAPAEPPLRR